MVSEDNGFIYLHPERVLPPRSHVGGVVVVPLTSQTGKVYPAEAMVTLNGESRKAVADQIMTASKRLMRSLMRALSSSDMRAVEDATLLHLSIHRD